MKEIWQTLEELDATVKKMRYYLDEIGESFPTQITYLEFREDADIIQFPIRED
jgi:hypothetical protein